MNMLKTFSKYAAGSIFALLAGLITTPILTRLFSTVEMGKYSMYVTMGSLIASLLYLGLDQSYVRYYNEELEANRNYLLFKCLQVSLLFCATITVVLILFYSSISRILVGEVSFVIVLIFSFYVTAMVINRFLMLKVRMAQKAGAYSMLNVLRKLAFLLFSVLLVFTSAGHSYWCLLIGVTLAEIVLMAGEFFVERGNWRAKNKHLSVSPKQLALYGLPFIFSTTVTLVFHSTDKLMLKAFSDYDQIGLYSGAQNIVNLITQVQMLFTTFWVPVAYEHYASKPEDTGFFIRMNKLVSYAMLVVCLAVFCLKDIIILFLGPDYAEAVYVFPFLAIMPIMYTISETTVMGINFKIKTSYHVWISAISALTNIGGNFLLIPLLGAKGAAVSTGLSYVVFFIMRTYLANRVYPIKFTLLRFMISVIMVYIVAIYASFAKVSIEFVALSIIIFVLITFLYRDIVQEGMNQLEYIWKSRRMRYDKK